MLPKPQKSQKTSANPASKKTPDHETFDLACEQEIQKLSAAFRNAEPSGALVTDLEKLLRTAIFKPAAEIFGELLQHAADKIDDAYRPKPGEVRKGRQPLQIQGIFGCSTLLRSYFYHPGKKQGHHPADEALGLEGHHTPALARLICLEGSDETSYQKAALHLLEVGGIDVQERQIQREVLRVGEDAAKWLRCECPPESCDAPVLYIEADYTGVPMRREELEGRKGKSPDGKAKTRMAALGCVFTQHQLDDQGRPMRDYESTTYLAGFESPSDFGIGLRHEAIRRGMGGVDQVIFLVDGALGLEKMGHDHFPHSIQIVDNYHALEHLESLIEALLTRTDARRFAKRRHHWRKMLLADGVERIIRQARKEASGTGREEAVEAQLGYFEHNIERMQYGTFRKNGWFIGSGVVEAGCRSVIGQRCKQSGMFWTEKGARAVMALRCINAGGRIQSFWNARHSKRAA